MDGWLLSGVVSLEAASKLTPRGDNYHNNNIVFLTARIKTDSGFWYLIGFNILLIAFTS